MKKLYLFLVLIIVVTVGYGQFTDINASLPGVSNSSVAWGDYDNDGDLDLLITGWIASYTTISKVYRNDGNGIFTDINAGLLGVSSASVAWGDYDNDGDLDILLTGYYSENSEFHCACKIYRNDGNGVFTDINAGLPGVGNSSVAWGDYDNDGKLDILLTGNNYYNSTDHFISKIYRNNGNGTFTDINAGLTGVSGGSVDWGDYDNDGYLDILLSGYNYDGTPHLISKIYRNNGNSTFTNIFSGLMPISSGTAVWGDYNNDGYLDILLSGYNYDLNPTTYARSTVYRNNGNGTFTDINPQLANAYTSSGRWGDYDNDGDLDILLIGYTSNGVISKVYNNNGNEEFNDINSGMVGVQNGSTAWGDYDNDGDLDVVLTGQLQDNNTIISKIYRNDGTVPNTAPTAPTNLRSSINGNYVNFQWNAATDAQTSSTGLNYNLRIGTTSGGNQILSSMSSASGYRKIPVKGNANANCSWKILRSALPEHFYWSVQAIDTAFSGSPFATEQEIISQPEITLLTSTSLQLGNTTINDLSNWFEIRIQNTNWDNVTISNLHFRTANSQFQYSYVNLGNPILPGEIDTIIVRFAPTTAGATTDTLFIESNAVNNPILYVRLSGTGTLHFPPALPQNVIITPIGNNVMLNWLAVTQDIQGNPLTPDGYLVFYNASNTDNDDDYYYLWETPNTVFFHYRVLEFSPRMFYRVIAYKDYGRGIRQRLIELEGSKQKVRYADFCWE